MYRLDTGVDDTNVDTRAGEVIVIRRAFGAKVSTRCFQEYLRRENRYRGASNTVAGSLKPPLRPIPMDPSTSRWYGPCMWDT